MKALRQKVAERNPDEFAFGMMSSTTKGGIKVTKRGLENGTEGPLSLDLAKLLKTQDAGYLQTVLSQTRRERERVEQEATIAGAGVDAEGSGHGIAKKTVFDEEGFEVPVRDEPSDISDDDMDNDMDDVPSGGNSTKDMIQIRRKQRRGQEVLSKRLELLASRERDLSTALERLEAQRARMYGTVGGVNKNGTKFKLRERKK